MERVWFESPDCKEDVLWAGILGSIARGHKGDASDMDFLTVLKDHIRSGQPIDLHEVVFSPNWNRQTDRNFSGISFQTL